MAEIVELDPLKEARGYVVDTLRRVLERAEAGEFASVHLCLFRADDGAMERQSSGSYNVHHVVASLELAKHGLIARNSFGEEDE
jgi:hypothetical protein